MKLTTHKDGKFSLVGITSAGLRKEEANIYKAVSKFPKIHYVSAGKPEDPVLFRKETK